MAEEQGLQLNARNTRLPTLEEITNDVEMGIKMDGLNAILSNPPPPSWIKAHPYVNIKVTDNNGQERSIGLPYITIDKVKYLLTKIFQRWEWHIKECKQLFNAICVTGTLRVHNPVNGEWIEMDGVGAVDVQTKAGASPAEMDKIVSSAVMKAAPAAESYALKNAAEKLGNIFGGNIIKDVPPYVPSYAEPNEVTELKDLLTAKEHLLTPDELIDAERIIKNKERSNYKKLQVLLNSK